MVHRTKSPLNTFSLQLLQIISLPVLLRKRTFENKGYNLQNLYFLTVLLSIPFNKLPMEKAMYKLAEDVTHRIFTGLKGILENESEVPQLSSFLIIKCFQEGKSKSGFFSKITNNCGGKLGNKKEVENAGIKLRNIFEKFTTEELFCKPAIRKNDCIVGETSEYLYRYAFFKENLMFSDRKVIQFDNYKELNSIRIETVDHFTFLSSQKGALLKQLYTKLQSPEFNALKEVAMIMAKNQNEFLRIKYLFKIKNSMEDALRFIKCLFRNCTTLDIQMIVELLEINEGDL